MRIMEKAGILSILQENWSSLCTGISMQWSKQQMQNHYEYVLEEAYAKAALFHLCYSIYTQSIWWKIYKMTLKT